MNGTGFERFSQENKRNQAPINSILEEDESVAQGVLESIQKVAVTTACKGVQIARLAEWGKQNGCWIEDVSYLGTFEDKGSENEVYLSANNDFVYKLNDFRYFDDNLTPFFERIDTVTELGIAYLYAVVIAGFLLRLLLLQKNLIVPS